MGNKGYRDYSKGKKEMIKNNSKCEKVFKSAQDMYNTNYRKL